jgi:hypothetical protein
LSSGRRESTTKPQRSASEDGGVRIEDRKEGGLFLRFLTFGLSRGGPAFAVYSDDKVYDKVEDKVVAEACSPFLGQPKCHKEFPEPELKA